MRLDDAPGRHPLCTCPELTFDAMTGRAPAPDHDACRERAPLGIDPHPVIDPDELNALLSPTHSRGPRSMAYLDMLFGAMRPPEPLDAPALGIVVDAIETRPQDWAEPARRILEERRALRQYRR